MTRVSFLIATAALLAAACGGSGKSGVEPYCEPGDPQVCDCTGGGQGVQKCDDSGEGWGPCLNCPVPDPDVIVEPDNTPPPEDIQPEVEPPPEDIQPEVEPDVAPPIVCLLNNCTSDAHCTGCSDDRHTCLIAENRCVACNPNTQEGCAEGEECSGFGICVPVLLTCPTDAQGNPTVVCLKNSDCKACSPLHQVCDTGSHQCVGCTVANTSHCGQSDVCIEGVCSPKCPQSCNLDNDCMYCGAPESPAHACNNHKCSQCSKTWPCPQGEICLSNGTCYPPCGLPGTVQGTCNTASDCDYCGDPKNPGVYDCKKPVNDPNGHGTCVPPAEGCADLGVGIAVLPEPWSDYTQLCSIDANCAQAGIDLNVGKLIRDLAGVDSVMGVAIGDATVGYEMPICAAVSLTGNIDCGICVPCKVDADCLGIPVDPLIMDLFKGNPLAQIAGAILIDMLYGDNNAHDLNFFCQPVGLGYGVCTPCGNPLQPCGKDEDPGGSGTCDHDVCTEGTALDPSCGACAATVCSNDSYCCTTAWDNVCVAEVDQYCATTCGGGGGCDADICTNDALDAQDPSCGPCVAAVCELDSFCCNKQSGAWDSYCVAEAAEACPDLCGGGGGCLHSECETGGPLSADCSECATAVCGYDDWCCTQEWDSICVEEAEADNNCSCFI